MDGAVTRLLWLTTLAGALLAGCEDRNPSILVEANIRGDDECVFTVDGVRKLGGTLDTALRSTYWVHPLYRNQVLNTASIAPATADSSGFHVLGASIELRRIDGEAFTTNVTTTYGIGSDNTFVPSATETAVGQIVGGLEVIPPSVGEMLRTEVQSGGGFDLAVDVRVYGKTSGGHSIELPVWNLQIRICSLCLVDFNPEADDPTINGVCDSTSSPALIPCNRGQDDPLDCRLCRNSSDAMVSEFCRGN